MFLETLHLGIAALQWMRKYQSTGLVEHEENN